LQVKERRAGDVAELRRRAKSETGAMQRDRYRAVVLAIEGQRAPAIARALGRSRRSVQDWVYAYRDGGIERLGIKPRPGRPTKLPREREADFRARLEPLRGIGHCTPRLMTNAILTAAHTLKFPLILVRNW
jgi:transposase